MLYDAMCPTTGLPLFRLIIPETIVNLNFSLMSEFLDEKIEIAKAHILPDSENLQ